MTRALRREVTLRARSRCEYCRLRQEHEPDSTFHVEHVIATSHRGSDDLKNLALACQLCNLRKGPNLSSIDPDSGGLERLFHPRSDMWADHFGIDGPLIFGLTAIGRTTAWLLEFNNVNRVDLRAALIELGEWP
jgi:hypothetical protein